MTDAPVPLPRRGRSDDIVPDGPPGEAIPIRRRAVAVLDAAAPPWLRVPPPRRVHLVAVPEPVAVHRPPVLRARPPAAVEPDILGLSRRSRGRWGSRMFTLFFVAVYALILGHLVFTLVHG